MNSLPSGKTARWLLPILVMPLLFAGCADNSLQPGPGPEWSLSHPGAIFPFAVWGDQKGPVVAEFCREDGGKTSLLRLEGGTWKPFHAQQLTSGAFRDIWTDGSGKVYAVGNDQLFFFDGQTWATVETPGEPGLMGLWVDQAGVITLTAGNKVFRSEGASWADQQVDASAGYHGVWGSGPDDVFVVGAPGTILHFDGSAWTKMPIPPCELLADVFGFGPDDVYAVGNEGVILHYDGQTWTRESSPIDTRLAEVWGAGPGDIYAVGEGGVILHEGGSGWQRMPCPLEVNMWGVWGPSPGEIYAVGDNAILKMTGGVWRTMVETSVFGGGPVWCHSGKRAFVLGSTGQGPAILHFDGTKWSGQEVSASNFLNTLWGDEDGTAWVAEIDAIAAFDGAALEEVSIAGKDIWDISGVAKDDIMAVGDRGDHLQGGCALHFDGAGWTEQAIPACGRLTGVWGYRPGYYFAVGESGSFLHYQGAFWTALEGVRGCHFRRLDGAWASDLYATAWFEGEDTGRVMHYDGDSWSVMDTPFADFYLDVWVRGIDDVYVVTSGGAIHHFDGETWQPAFLGITGAKYIHGDKEGNIFVTPVRGAVYRFGL